MWLSGQHDRGAWYAVALAPGVCGALAVLGLAFVTPGLYSGRIYSTVHVVTQRHPSARSHATPEPAYAPIGPSTAVERALRRRIVRMARIKMLARRERELREFLANARSEVPLFEDGSVTDVGLGVLVGPTIVTRDFLGEAMVRAVVRNTSAVRRAPLLTVHVATSSEERDATVALDGIAPGESRRIELIVPTRAAPLGAHWSAAPDF